MIQKVITMRAELNSSGNICIDSEKIPKGYRVKHILSSKLDCAFTMKELNKKIQHFLVTLIVEPNSDSSDEKHDTVSYSMDQYI